MKRFLLSAAAGLIVAGSISLPAVAQGRGSQSGQYQQGQYNGNDRDDRAGDRRSDNDRGRNGSGQKDRGRKDHGRQDRGSSQYHDGGSQWRDTRRDARWNDRDHNGYYVGREWHRGQPSARDYNRSGFSLGYQPWERGDRLGSYNNRYGEVDYRDYGVRRPPQGYRWVKDDNTGDLLLAAVVGGLIAAIISNY